MSPRRRESGMQSGPGRSGGGPRLAWSRGLAAAAAALVLSTTATGCYAGFEPQSHLIGKDRVSATVGPITLRAVQLVKAPGSDTVALIGALLNGGDADDELTGVQIGDAGTGGVLSSTVKIALPADRMVTLGGPGNPAVTVEAAERLPLGHFVPLKLSFRDAGDVTMQVPVEDGDGALTGYAPAPKTATPPTVQPTTGQTETPGGPAGGAGGGGGGH